MRGAWPIILSSMLTRITRASLPALLLSSLGADAGASPSTVSTPSTRLPASRCVGCSIDRSKLIMEGSALIKSDLLTSNQATAADGSLRYEYTLRTGMSHERTALSSASGLPLPAKLEGRMCSTLVWDNPELKLSLGETGLASLLPPVSACAFLSF